MSHIFHNAGIQPGLEPVTIFLPGWGFDGRILKLLHPAPAWIYPEDMLDPATLEQDLLHLLAAENLNKVRLVGWSMGGMLGLEFSAKHGEFVDSLVLAALRPGWPGAEIAAIREEFSRDPEGFLKAFYRKCFLGDKQSFAGFRAHLEPRYLAAVHTNMEKLQRGLDFLESFRLPDPAPDVPTRLLHGKRDIIAPVQEMATLPGAHMEIIDTAGHAVFLHADCSLLQELKKKGIREKFSRAADSYDSYAKVQAEAALQLAARLPAAQNKPATRTILEIGCGTGNFTVLLAHRFPQAKIVALDFSPEMLARARLKLHDSSIEFICAEGEQFLQQTPAASFDLVVSNGSLQWFSAIAKALENIARILTPDGAMACSIFGPESLKELGEGIQTLKSRQERLAAQAFPTLRQLRKIMAANFHTGGVTEEYMVRKYPSAHDLLLHIKKTGTSGWHKNTHQPLTPARLKQLDAWFNRTYGACRVTYQVFFLQGSKSG